MTADPSQPGPDSGSSPTADARHRGGGGGAAAPGAGETKGRDARDSLLRDSLLVTRVDGMHSHTCEDRIVGSVSKLPGVKEVEVDFASGQASVIFDGRKVTVHQLIEAVEQAGYRCGEYALGSGGGSVSEG